MKRLKGMIMKDLGWKVLSFLIAIGLWFMVINIEHPVDTRVYTQNLQVNNISALTERGLTVSNLLELENTSVSFKVKGQRMALDRLSRYKDEIFVFVDLKNVVNARTGDTITLEAQILLPKEAGDGFEILNRSPVIVEVKVEALIYKEFPVLFSVEGGEDENFVLGELQILPESITVSGPESAVEQVVAVRCVLPVDHTVEVIDKKGIVHPYNKAGVVVNGVSLSAKEVRVVAGMYQSKEVPLKVDVGGVVAEGYAVGEMTMDPQKIMVYGDKKALKNFSVCQLPQVSVEGATKDVVETFEIEKVLPEGVRLVNGGALAIIRIHILEQNKVTLQIPVEKIKMNGTDNDKWQYHFLEDEVRVQCTGPAEVIKDLTAEQITGTVNVALLGEGQKQVEVKVELPQKITVFGVAPHVSIDIKKLVQDNDNTEIEAETVAKTEVETVIETEAERQIEIEVETETEIQ